MPNWPILLIIPDGPFEHRLTALTFRVSISYHDRLGSRISHGHVQITVNDPRHRQVEAASLRTPDGQSRPPSFPSPHA